MENITLSVAEISALTLLDSEQLTQKLTDETGQPLPETELKDTLKSLFSEKYAKIQKDSIGRGTRQSLQGKTREISQKYGITSPGDLIATVDAVVAAQIEQHKTTVSKKEGQPITKEQAMQNPEISAFIKKLQGENEGLKTKLTDQATGFAREKLLSKVKKQGVDFWLSKNPLLHKDENTRKKQIAHFSEILEKGHYSENEKGEIVVLDADGNQMQNDFKDVSFQQYVLGVDVFGFSPVEGGKGVPKKNPGGGETAIAHQFSDSDLTPKGYAKKKAELKSANDSAGAALLYQAFLRHNYPEQFKN